MCIQGFFVLINSVIGVSEDLLIDETQKYILTYKFSQDHLELFFNAVRRCGEIF